MVYKVDRIKSVSSSEIQSPLTKLLGVTYLVYCLTSPLSTAGKSRFALLEIPSCIQRCTKDWYKGRPPVINKFNEPRVPFVYNGDSNVKRGK